MSLSPDAISLCEDLLNRIATELVLANPGSDDGLVPVYALVNELSGIVEQNEPALTAACSHVRMALDELLDESQPFDQRTLGYIGEFTTWGHDCFLKLRKGEESPCFPPAAWLLEGDEASEGTTAALDMNRCEDLINRIATELVIASSGSDEGLVPMYALAHELAETAGDQQPQVVAAVAQFRAALDALLDNARPFDNATLDYVGLFTSWAQTGFQQLRQGASHLGEFPAMEGLEQVAPVALEAEEPFDTSEAFAEPDIEPAATPEANAELLAKVAKDSDVLMQLGDEDRELLGEFHTEATEHLENIEAAVLTLENRPKDADSLALIFRAFHTIKGVAGFLHLVPIQALAHEVETLLDYARNGKLVLNSEMITLILKGKDTIQALVEQIRVALEKGLEPSEVIPVSHLIVSVQLAAQQGLDIAEGRIAAATSSDRAATQALAPEKSALAYEDEPAPENEPAGIISEAGSPAAARKNAPAAAAAASADANGASSTIRVRTSKLDNLLDMVGELVIVQSQLSESGKMEQVDDNSPLQRNIAQLQRITRELQNTSMSLRLVPIKPTFQKVGRLVRDLSGNFGKKVNFVTEGEDTELDRNVVEQISDPLVHMIRNSLDHGLESGEERKGTGKPETGTLSLKAYHQGSSVVIELQDDGRGINPEKILKKAREKGLVREDQQPNKADILNLIFEPGFSTAEKVSDISGRGVGMDVVRRNIEKLRGKVELESELGQGTRFKIKLPLTTAIIDGLVVRVGEDRFILPTTSVKVALRPEKSQISKIKGKAEVLDLRGKTIPLVRLHKSFNIETKILNHWDGIVVIVETFGRPYGLLVDDMVSKQEVVIKNLGSMMKGIAGVAGGAILGDGNIALILDPSGLVGQN